MTYIVLFQNYLTLSAFSVYYLYHFLMNFYFYICSFHCNCTLILHNFVIYFFLALIHSI